MYEAVVPNLWWQLQGTRGVAHTNRVAEDLLIRENGIDGAFCDEEWMFEYEPPFNN